MVTGMGLNGHREGAEVVTGSNLFSMHLHLSSVHRWTWQVEHKAQDLCLLPHYGSCFLRLVPLALELPLVLLSITSFAWY